MGRLPTVDFLGHQVSRLICGGNPLSGFSHFSAELDSAMLEYYTMPRIQELLTECWDQGITAIQSRGDRHQMRMYLEHRLAGGRMQWIAQTATELANIPGNIAEIARYRPIAIYNHGTHTDNNWHSGTIEQVRDLVKAIHDQGLPAGVGTHIPEVVEYMETKGWETDFYMCCFYNLARRHKNAPAENKAPDAREEFPAGDPARMTAVMRQVRKPCIGFKIMAAGRNCSSPQAVEQAFRFAFENIKPGDIVDVGMFQRDKNQVRENADIVRRVLDAV